MGFYDAMRIGAVLVRGLFQQVAENGRVRRSSGYVTTLAGRRSSTRKGVAMRYSSDPLMAAATEAEDVGPPRRLLDGVVSTDGSSYAHLGEHFCRCSVTKYTPRAGVE